MTDSQKDSWWGIMIGRSSSIDTLDSQSTKTAPRDIFSNEEIKSAKGISGTLPAGEEAERYACERQITQKVVDDYMKSVKLIDDQDYKHPAKYAEEVTNSVILESQKLLKKCNYNVQIKFQIPPNITWPKQGEFNIFSGLANIDEYVGTWVLHPDWKYLIELKNIKEGPFGTEYDYEVKFSCPRRQFPVAQATASVFFYVITSPWKPYNSEIDVYFTVESMESKFYPGNVIFNQKWLEMVVDSKIHFFKQIRR